MKPVTIILVVIAGVILLCALWFRGVYNGFVGLDEGVNSAWAQVQNQYQRRLDLIPNLVEVVKGYAAHEKEVFEKVAEARSSVGKLLVTPDILNNPQTFQKFQEAQAGLSSALSRLIAVAENYPQLKANENFLALQAELSNTEDRLQTARRFYNANVRDYNRRVQSFPSNLIAAWFKFQEEEFFEVEEALRQAGAPQVNFTGPGPSISFGSEAGQAPAAPDVTQPPSPPMSG